MPHVAYRRRRPVVAAQCLGKTAWEARLTTVMGHGQHSHAEDEPARSDAGRALVWVPCLECGRGVRLFDENRVRGDSDLYQCPSCGSRFAVTADDP